MNKKHLTIGTIALVVLVFGILYNIASQLQLGIEPAPSSNFVGQQQNTLSDDAVQQQATLPGEISKANNLFSIDLYNKYKSKEGNLFFSPYGVLSGLSMAYEGAKGRTAEEMQRVLRLPNDMEEIRLDFKRIYEEINGESKPYKLTIANALWAQQDYPFRQDYLKLVEDYYGGKVTNLDFKENTEDARITINNWAAEKTSDKIKDLLSKDDLDPQTRLVLTNAIYFKANWSSQFDPKDTREAGFELSSGDLKSVKMMNNEDNFNYGETEDLQILEMDYLGGDLSMLIILPKENDLSSVENSISVANLADWKKNMHKEKVSVSIPKFSFETKYIMNEDLKEMGMPTAFSKDADFGGMWHRSGGENLYIHKTVQKTFIGVSESGTEASASTAVVVRRLTSAGPSGSEENVKIFRADHPFIFVIQQKNSGNILFMGRVSDPTIKH